MIKGKDERYYTREFHIPFVLLFLPTGADSCSKRVSNELSPHKPQTNAIEFIFY